MNVADNEFYHMECYILHKAKQITKVLTVLKEQDAAQESCPGRTAEQDPARFDRPRLGLHANCFPQKLCPLFCCLHLAATTATTTTTTPLSFCLSSSHPLNSLILMHTHTHPRTQTHTHYFPSILPTA